MMLLHIIYMGVVSPKMLVGADKDLMGGRLDLELRLLILTWLVERGASRIVID